MLFIFYLTFFQGIKWEEVMSTHFLILERFIHFPLIFRPQTYENQ